MDGNSFCFQRTHSPVQMINQKLIAITHSGLVRATSHSERRALTEPKERSQSCWEDFLEELAFEQGIGD